MADLKQILGNAYHEGMTFDDIQKAINDNNINLADLSQGGYVSKEKYERLDNDFKEQKNLYDELSKKTHDYDDLSKFKADTEAQNAEAEIKKQLKNAGFKDEFIDYGLFAIEKGKIETGDKLAESAKAFLNDNPNYGVAQNAGDENTPNVINTSIGNNNNGNGGGNNASMGGETKSWNANRSF